MATERHPKGLTVLFLTEMWERFSFYLMLGILPLYLTDSQKGGMGWTDGKMSIVLGSYTALVYLTPFIGGLLADRLLGYRNSILIGAFLMMVGHIVLAMPTEIGLYVGLGFLIIGNGAFKPNISTLLGNLYPPGSPLKDAGFSIFYVGINVGAFICNFVAAFVRNYFDEHPMQITAGWEITGWHAAFGTAGIGMFIGLVVFALNYRRFAAADTGGRSLSKADENLTPLWVQCVAPAVALGALGWFLSLWFPRLTGYDFPLNPVTSAFVGVSIPVVLFYFTIWRNLQNPTERSRVGALLVIFGISIVFWMTFSLNTTVLNVWTRDDTHREPNALIRPLTETFTEFAENAPPSYFKNADPGVPRPAKSTFEIVSDTKYKELEKAKKLSVKQGEKVFVTQKMFDEIYADTDSATPLLPEKEHLKLINAELFQSINPGYVILFTPLVVGFWHLLRKRGKEPSTTTKIALGVLILAGGPLIMLAATAVSGDGAIKVSASWLFGTYAIVTVAELCLSPMGLSLVNKTSPPKIRAFMMGGWFLSTTFGNKLSGICGELYTAPGANHYAFWIALIASNLLFAGVIFSLLPWLKRQMGDENAIPGPLTPQERKCDGTTSPVDFTRDKA